MSRIIGQIFRNCKQTVQLYLVFRRLSHEQIAALVRQAEAEKPKPKGAPKKVEFQLKLGPRGQAVLVEL
jgi:hypothetical protein